MLYCYIQGCDASVVESVGIVLLIAGFLGLTVWLGAYLWDRRH